MAYGLKYYKELTQPNGKVVRLEILEKGYEGASKEIGPVCQALRLDIQGDTEIDAPIVKTSLSMTFVDAPDHADARTKKCGNWDEFYTSDATLWRVVLKARNAQETAFTTMWGGYITPDSYTEVLQYRGSVTLVARDNIGHLSDFPFDAEGNADGMISLIELIREAWDKIESPMTLDDQAVANADWMLSDGVYAYDTYMNVSAFEDMNWYDALESALYAYGLVLRYTGNNNVSFYSLRNLPRMGAHEVEDISFIEPTFMSGAERELTPAVKRIEEAVDYEIVEQKAAPMGESVTFTGASSTIPFESMNVFGEKEWKDIPTWPIDNTTNEGWGNDKNKTLFYSPKAYGYDSVVGGNELYLATNTDGSGSVWYGLHMQGKSFKFTLAFGQLIERVNVPLYLSPIIVKKVNVIVSASANGITSYLNAGGSWQTSEAVLSLSIDEETSAVTKVVPLGAFSLDETLVKVTIKNVSLGARAGEEWWDVSRGNGIYVAINALTFADNNGEALCETNRVNTNYDAKNNIILSRDPKIAPALNDVLFPSIIKNGIFVKEGRTYNPAKTWYWGGQTPQQMAVYNHLQLLCYHAKPNNILRGTIVNADVADMQVIWMWHGAEHMLVSGTLDLISGYIENAVLREFARYEDMWGMLEPADMPEVEGKSSTNVEGGATASNEGARMTSTTTVNIGGGSGSIVLDTFMSDTSQNGVQNRVIKAYVDNSCSDLDTRLNEKADNTTVTALAERVSANEGAIDDNAGNIKKNSDAIDALDKRVTAEEAVTTTYASWWADLKKYIKVEGDNVKIDTNLIVEGDTSSGGSGQDTPASGTVTGIKVGPTSTDILTPNNAGIIDMVSVLSSIDVSDQLTAYAKTENVNAALLTKQDTISDLATIRSGAALGATALQKITKTMVDSVLGSTTAGNANRFLMSTGSTSVWAAISKDMVTDALGYTPLSTGGGTMTGSLNFNAGLSIKSANNIVLEMYSGVDTYLRGSSHIFLSTPSLIYQDASGTTHSLLHSGNYSDYALPLSGGTIDGSLRIGKEDNTGYKYLMLIRSGHGVRINNIATEAYFTFGAVDSAGIMTAEKVLLMGDGGLQYSPDNSTYYDIIHSGNIGSQNVASANAIQVNYSRSNTDFDIMFTNPRAEWSAGIDAVYISDKSDRGLTYNPSTGTLKLNGNVLVGTTTDSGYKLDVNGEVRLQTSAIEYFTALRLTNPWYGGSGNKHTDIVFDSAVNYRGGIIRCTNEGAYGSFVSLNFGASNDGVNGFIPYMTISANSTTINNYLEVNGALTSYGGFISYGAPSYTAIRDSGWSYLRLQSASQFWDIATTNASDGMLNTPYALEFRERGYGNWGFALRRNTSSFGIGVFVANGEEASIGFLSNSSASSNKLPQWVIGNRDADTFGFWNTWSERFGLSISRDFTMDVGGNICINRPSNYDNNYDEGLRCNLGGSTSWAGIVIGGAANSTSGTDIGVYSLLVNNKLFRIRQNNYEVLTINTSSQVNINGDLIVSGDTSSGSDIRFKDIIKDKTLKIEHIAKAPLFTFKWNDREDDSIHLGSSAQYWEKVAPWLVKGEDFKTLDYSTLGVAIGISLAKKAVNHEERIKVLEKENKALKEEIRRMQYGS